MDLKKRINNGQLLAIPGCFDVVSAMLIEDAGFEAIFVSGYGISASSMGYPDIGLLGMNEMLSINRHIKVSVKIPVITDIDNAYGDLDHVKTVIHSLNEIGIDGIQMEDQGYPKSCGHTDGKRTITTEEYLRKLDTVMNYRHDDMIVIARTDAGDVDEGIKRLNQYHNAGADLLIMDGLRSVADVKQVAESVKGPVMLNLILGGKTPVLTEKEAHKLGISVLLYSTPLLFSVKNQMSRALDTLITDKNLASLASESSHFNDYHNYIQTKFERRFE